jgi:vitamin B12 transporter
MPETGSRLHASIGTGFRAPSLAENLFAFGNPNLAPETSKGWDYGLEQSLWTGPSCWTPPTSATTSRT